MIQLIVLSPFLVLLAVLAVVNVATGRRHRFLRGTVRAGILLVLGGLVLWADDDAPRPA